MRRISIQNSKKVKIQITLMDSVHIQDVFIRNNSVIENTQVSLFEITTVHNLIFNNLTVLNNIGPVLSIQSVLSKVITNFSFENVSNSGDVSGYGRPQIRIKDSIKEINLNRSKPYITIFQNVSLNVRIHNEFILGI